MRIAVFAGLALAAVALTPGNAHAAKDPTPAPVATNPSDPYGSGLSFESVSYGPQRRQDMDVWWTADGSRRPGVFIVHGGWWSSGDKRYMTSVSRAYAEQGYTVFNINYRLSGQASWPAQRTDALDAIATAKRHAARWSFDPKNFVVVGFSAGGHIAASVGTYGNGLSGLRGVVGLSPIISPLLAYTDGLATTDPYKRRLRASAVKLAGGCAPKGRCSRVWASMEVAWHASPGDAPMLTVHSRDEFVPPAQSQPLRQMLGQVGVPVTVVTVPGVAHSTPLYREPSVTERVQQWISERFTQE
ncbi:alpha/beta hydrolase [Nonomuraea lactucae]|uniref:alpha/beta hydrolase n=1 Tax=Nonomuraea lactucae TaxID=2249762 RepID=UPI001F06940D|nr:alpha/beta hydrolase [Nonomuraea lactucae]